MSSARYYSQQEDDLLRQHYPTATKAELSVLFPGRSPHGLEVRAHRLGLRKNLEAREMGMPFTGSVIGHLKETERAYLAGILDGEGCISIQRRTHLGPHKPIYALYVGIYNTSPALKEWLDSRLPGIAIYRHDRRNGRKPCFHWMLSGNRRVIVFLREIAPYLVIKKVQAELLSSGYLHLSEPERYQLWQQMRAARRNR